MIRHCVMFTFAEGTTPEQIATMEAALQSLPGAIPEIQSYTMGPDAGLAEGNKAYVVVGDFASADDYTTYAGHDAHIAVITEHIRPILASRSAIQYEL